MLTAFLMFRGILSKQYQLTALSFGVIFLYGSFIWYIFPTDPKISWEGHLSGFLVGVVFAFIFNKQSLPNKKYAWQKEDYDPSNDPFMRNFDEDGNFIDTKADAVDEAQKIPTINYVLKKQKLKREDDL